MIYARACGVCVNFDHPAPSSSICCTNLACGSVSDITCADLCAGFELPAKTQCASTKILPSDDPPFTYINQVYELNVVNTGIRHQP
jgi:hypothetical protein